MSSLELRSLSVTLGRRRVVDDLSCTVPSGGWLSLIGPNGAGKSSVLRAVAGIVAHGGEVLVDGASLSLRHRNRRAAIVAHVPQDPILPDDMSGVDYVMLGRSPHIGYFASSSRHDRAMVADVIDRLGLEGLAGRRLGAMSGGERQRFGIARALATEAPILLLDEPTSALDIGHQQQALELVARLRREHGLTVVSAMHDLTLAGMYGDEMALLHAGSVVASGAVIDVLRADTLAEFYGVSVRVHHDPDGTVIVVPSRPPLGAF